MTHAGDGMHPGDRTTSPGSEPAFWVDRHGNPQIELGRNVPTSIYVPDRCEGPLEKEWRRAESLKPEQRELRRAQLHARTTEEQMPLISEDPCVLEDTHRSNNRNTSEKETPHNHGDTIRYSLYTWVFQSREAKAVYLWANGLHSSYDMGAMELNPLPYSDLWVITLRLPSAWQASYLFVEWKEETIPPWHHPHMAGTTCTAKENPVLDNANSTDANRLDTSGYTNEPVMDTGGKKLLACPETKRMGARSQRKISGILRHRLIELGQPDPRNPNHVPTRGNHTASVARGPYALNDPWFTENLEVLVGIPKYTLTDTRADISINTKTSRDALYNTTGDHSPGNHAPVSRTARIPSLVTTVQLPHAVNEKTTIWIYQPRNIGESLPLLVLFDGGMWNSSLRLPHILDRAISRKILPPIAVAMIDAQNMNNRWNNLGVPTGQVDFLLDQVLPWVHGHCDVRSDAASTFVAGQSLGGLSALWSLALGGDHVGHAIAQSPALWRFSVADSLLANRQWMSAVLQAGTYEQHTHHLTADLARTLISSQKRSQHQHASFQSVEGGHDWAWWRVALLNSVSHLLIQP